MKFDLVSRGRCCIELLCAQPGLLLFLKRTKSTTAPRVTRYGTERGCHEKEKGGCFSYFFSMIACRRLLTQSNSPEKASTKMVLFPSSNQRCQEACHGTWPNGVDMETRGCRFGVWHVVHAPEKKTTARPQV